MRTVTWEWAADPGVDRLREYPRPQMMRKQWTDLNGLWDYAFSDSKEYPENWDGEILVPFSPEAKKSGVERILKPGEYLHYRRLLPAEAFSNTPVDTSEDTFEDVSEDASNQDDLEIRRSQNRRTILHFGAVDQACTVYVNRRKVGSHVGGYLEFSFDITDYLYHPTTADSGDRPSMPETEDLGDRSSMPETADPGDRLSVQETEDTVSAADEPVNELWLVVRDDTERSPLTRGKQKYDNHGPLSSIFYPCQSGIWKDVWMEQVPETYIEHLKIETKKEEGYRVKITLDVRENVPSQSMDFRQQSMDFRQQSMDFRQQSMDFRQQSMDFRQQYEAEYAADDSAGLRREVLSLDIFSPILWSPENPHLYFLKIRCGEDEVLTYFALRTISVGKDEEGIARIYLNQKQVFLNGLLDQGYWPESLMTPPTKEALRYDIEKVKSLGFNTLRKHVKVEDEHFYYECDRLGILVIQDMPNGGGDYNMYFQAYLPNGAGNLVRGLSDRNYARFRRDDSRGRDHFLGELEGMIRQLGNHPSIVMWVPFNEGWGQFDAAQVSRLVKSWDPSRLVNEACGWFDQGGGDLYSIHNYFRKLKVKPQGDRVVALTEYGGFSYPVAGHTFEEKDFGYRHYQNAEELTEAYVKLWEEQIFPNIPKGLSVAVYTQVSDVFEEINGIMTFDRAVDKILPEPVRELNRRVCTEAAAAVDN